MRPPSLRDMRAKHGVFTLKYLLLGLGFLLTLAAFAAIAVGYVYFSFGSNKQLLEKYLSEQINRPLQIQSISTRWSGLYAVIDASGVRVRRSDGTQSSLRLGELQIWVDPLALLTGRHQLERLVVKGLTVEVFRELDGTVRIGDIPTGARNNLEPLRWFLEQEDTEIRDGKMVWQDRREPGRTLVLDAVNIKTRRAGDAIRFHGQASPPQDLIGPVKMQGVVHAQPLRLGMWDAEIAATLSNLDLGRLPRVLREVLPWRPEGLVDAEIRTKWQQGRISTADVKLDMSGLVMAVGESKQSLLVDRFSSAISWRHDPNRWRLSFEKPALYVGGRPLSAARVTLERRDDARIYRADDIKIREFVGALAQSGIELPWQQILSKLRPFGELKHLSVVAKGPVLAPQDWRFEGDFEGLSWEAFDRFPGMFGADGSLVVDPLSGLLKLSSNNASITMPGMLAEPVKFSKLQGDVDWKKAGGEWHVNTSGLELSNPDIRRGRGRFNLRIPANNAGAVYMDGEFTADSVEMDKLKYYLPVGLISERATSWLDNALLTGSLTEARVAVTGDLDRFPFPNGGGSFSVNANIADGTLHYADRWPDLVNIHGSLGFDNTALSVKLAYASMMNSQIESGTVKSDDIFTRNSALTINAHLAVPAQDAVQFMSTGPLVEEGSTLKLSASGSGDLDLDIFLPLSRLAEGATVEGRYAMKDVQLTVADQFKFTQADGDLAFTESSIQSSGVAARFMGGDVLIGIETIQAQTPPVWVARAWGEADTAELASLLGDNPLSQHLTGSAHWNGALTVEPGLATLEIHSDMEGVALTLPPPLAKPADPPRAASMRAEYRRDKHKYRFEFGSFTGHLQYLAAESGLQLDNGRLSLGKKHADEPSGAGVRIEVRQRDLNADAWLKIFEADKPASPRSGFQSALRGIALEVENLRMFSRDLGAVYMRAESDDGFDWEASLSGDAVAGKALVSLRNDEPDRYALELEHLYWPRQAKDVGRTGGARPDQYPHLSIHADRFRFGDWELGEMDLAAESYAGRWRVDKLNFEQPGLRILADGHWLYGDAGSSTEIRSSVSTDDVAVALDRLKFPPNMAESEASLRFELKWPGDPQSFALNKLDGEFDLSAGPGRFLNVEPGSGRLLGLFNVDAISRRFSLDFSDIFDKGLAYDHIRGQGSISSGNLYSEGLYMAGPSALIEINGRTGLATEDYEMEVVVAPQLGSHISMLSALANPLAGAMVFVVQKVFQKQLAKMVHYKYEITGSWESPTITSIKMEPKIDIEGGR